MGLEIDIVGSTKNKRKLAQDAVEFAIQALVPRIRNLYIKVELIHKLLEKEEIYGDCIHDDYSMTPREFTVRIDSNLNHEDFLKTIFHEMTHVKQYARRELYDYVRKPGCKWKKEYHSDKYINNDEKPWEKDAYNYENILYDSWSQLN